MAAQDQELLATRRVPHPNRVVPGPADDARAIRREPGGPDGPLMAAQDQELLATRRVPHPNRVVLGPAHDARAIRREPGGSDASSWPRRTKSSLPLAASHTRTVWSSDPLTMRAPSGENPAALDGPLMAAQDQELLAARRVPHPNRVVQGPADDARAIRREPGGMDRALMAAQDLQLALGDHGLDQGTRRLADPRPGFRVFGLSGRPARASCMAVTGKPSPSSFRACSARNSNSLRNA